MNSKEFRESGVFDPLYSQRLELSRVVRWLESERFKCDQSKMTMRGAAEEIAQMLRDGTYTKDRRFFVHNEVDLIGSLEPLRVDQQEKPDT